ncbi:MAG: hypothetical protein M3280_12050 [Actinomycetota bacterium]|nr:hypothetical protein [Actinomycetota bacterium]
MAPRPEVERRRAQAETDSLTGGPGIVATKSQARGALAGIAVGALVGLVIGIILGLIIDALIVAPIVTTVAGAVVGGVAAGGQNPKQKLGSKSEADY